MLGAGHDVFLNADREGRSHSTDVVRVLAVGLLRAPPLRVTNDVCRGPESDIARRGGKLIANRLTDALFEIEIPRRRTQRLRRKCRGVVLAVRRAVWLTGIEVHASTHVAVPIAANLTDPGYVDVGAPLDIEEV